MPFCDTRMRMAPGQDDPKPEDGKILSPDELDITDDEHVEQLDEGRYVVSPDARTESVTGTVESADRGSDRAGSERPGREPAESRAFDSGAVHEWLFEDMRASNARYGFDVTAKFGDAVGQRRLVSNDVVTTFENLVLWYAEQIDADTPVEEVLGILLLEANVPVRYPPRSLKQLVASTELDPDDSIADLLAAVEDGDGVEL